MLNINFQILVGEWIVEHLVVVLMAFAGVGSTLPVVEIQIPASQECVGVVLPTPVVGSVVSCFQSIIYALEAYVNVEQVLHVEDHRFYRFA